MHCEQASAKARATGTINDIERVYMLFIMNSFLITKKKIKKCYIAIYRVGNDKDSQRGCNNDCFGHL
jgi:hypothetical protein